MNILPHILFFLLLFALLASSSLKSTIATRSLKSGIDYLTGDRLARSAAMKCAYQEALGKKEKETGKPKREKKSIDPNRTYHSLRLQHQGKTFSKLNLAHLGASPQVQKIAHELLALLYSHTDLYPMLLLHQEELFAHIAAAAKGKKKLDFQQLSLSHPDCQKLFYTLIRGTNSFNLEKKEGIAKFGDFFCYDEEMADIYFVAASLPLLQALFNKEITDAIVNIEGNKWAVDHHHRTTTKKELEDLLMNTGWSTPQVHEVLSLFSFQSKFPQQEWRECRAKKGKVAVRRDVN